LKAAPAGTPCGGQDSGHAVHSRRPQEARPSLGMAAGGLAPPPHASVEVGGPQLTLEVGPAGFRAQGCGAQPSEFFSAAASAALSLGFTWKGWGGCIPSPGPVLFDLFGNDGQDGAPAGLAGQGSACAAGGPGGREVTGECPCVDGAGDDHGRAGPGVDAVVSAVRANKNAGLEGREENGECLCGGDAGDDRGRAGRRDEVVEPEVHADKNAGEDLPSVVHTPGLAGMGPLSLHSEAGGSPSRSPACSSPRARQSQEDADDVATKASVAEDEALQDGEATLASCDVPRAAWADLPPPPVVEKEQVLGFLTSCCDPGEAGGHEDEEDDTEFQEWCRQRLGTSSASSGDSCSDEDRRQRAAELCLKLVAEYKVNPGKPGILDDIRCAYVAAGFGDLFC